ncbi:5-(carboxyamino)imidazole ribonucleotide mutase [Companilactobacillus metriopterae]|uniref:5-(carboxyamino)imidazole ribonucleotide mutase n=1 Tax=Companilactobacillus metriopterae TaxID=1909267 RepID=UPI00100BE569|nr:5-(carboxyamino)imidazole ribonucleotide mutase [Companilactobacillus metriopterae]
MDVSVVMGSVSDLKTMQLTSDLLEKLEVNYDMQIISAHRTPKEMMNFAERAADRGTKVIIAAAGGAAHLPGMLASLTEIPVIGVPIKSNDLNGIDSLLSIVQMPAGIPVATVAIGESGAKNAAILATKICALSNKQYKSNILNYMTELHDKSIESGKNIEY